jgi:zinc transport system ATP-binding protein
VPHTNNPDTVEARVSDTRPVVRVDGVTFGYDDTGRLPILEDVTLEIGPRDFLGLIGPNGGGKTTLLRVLLGQIRPQQGVVEVLGRPPREVSAQVGYVPQHAQIDATVPATVLDVVLTGRIGRARWGLFYGPSHVTAARDALASVGIADLASRRIGDLSGGQRQRVLIARALVDDVKILLLDEPMAGVDLHMEQGILELLQKLNERLPLVLVTHDIGFVSSHVGRVACLNRRLVTHDVGEITDETITEMYAAHGPVRIVRHEDGCPVDHHVRPDEGDRT